jgi:hydrogenase maturation protein HypF
LEVAESQLKEKFSNTEWSIYSKLLSKGSRLKTSSVGRIFDGVASLLGILDKQTFEGEAAMRLEAMAVKYVEQNGMEIGEDIFGNETFENQVPTKMLVEGVNSDVNLKKSKGFIAAKFHYSLAKLVRKIAENLKIEHIAFSGGVFQNGLLIDFILHEMQDDFKLYFHKQLSPNDESVSFGQLVCYHIEQLEKNKTQYHVLSNTR